MQTFEMQYAGLLRTILHYGDERECRNGKTRSMFGMDLVIPMQHGNFPLIQGRKMYYKGVLGELAAMVRQPTCLADFEAWGCNYWKQWAKPDGSINVDYGNAWFRGGQIDHLLHCLEHSPYDRRMLINGWDAERLQDLDLPCCHYSYQFYVGKGKLDMIWNQRSVDMMVGLPSDIVLAAAWLIVLAKQFGYQPGRILMNLGDCHIYEEHFEACEVYLERINEMAVPLTVPKYHLNRADFLDFRPDDLIIADYEHCAPIKLKVKA